MTVRDRYDQLPNWCSARQVASFLEVSVQYVYRMLRNNQFSVQWRTEGGRWRISKESVAQLVGLAVDPGDEP